MKKCSEKVWFWRDMPKSKAFLELSGKAPHVLLIFQTKLQMTKRNDAKAGGWEIGNNGEIVFTYREAASKYGIDKGQFTRALDQLIERGFIEIRRRGSGLHRSTTLYAVIEDWRLYGTDKFTPRSREKDMRVPGFFGGEGAW
ncbi:MAG: hypothetical protein ABIF82_06210 [Planctomycetota bacterium]